jgi:hypothetical protein
VVNDERSRERNRILWLVPIAVVVLLGLGPRRLAARLPGIVAAYTWDTLWATAAFLGFGLFLPRASTWRIGLQAMLVFLLVEVSQLSKAPWLDTIRRTTIGGLVLGYGFVWGDLARYVVGVGLGMVVESALAGSSGRGCWRLSAPLWP